MHQQIICDECNLGRKVSILGNGITEPPYVTVIECPFEKDYYMDRYCDCKYEHEKERYRKEN